MKANLLLSATGLSTPSLTKFIAEFPQKAAQNWILSLHARTVDCILKWGFFVNLHLDCTAHHPLLHLFFFLLSSCIHLL